MSNKNLTRELAQALVRSREVVCPSCKGAVLATRYKHKSRNTQYKCKNCGEVYHPCKLI